MDSTEQSVSENSYMRQIPRGPYHIEKLTPQRDEIDSGIYYIRKESLQQFLDSLRQRGHLERTLYLYQQRLNVFYDYLPEDKTIRYGTLKDWQDYLIEQKYANASINSFLAIVNMYLDFIGRREYQLLEYLERQPEKQPKLSRDEYLQLLKTARKQGNERAYLLIKFFGTVEFSVKELSQITVEAVKVGKISFDSNRIKKVVRLPRLLREELLSFAEHERIQSGPIFYSNDGALVDHGRLTRMVAKVCSEAGIAENKCSPRCLQKLCQSTQANIESNIQLQVDRAYNRLLEEEQRRIGWNNV